MAHLGPYKREKKCRALQVQSPLHILCNTAIFSMPLVKIWCKLEYSGQTFPLFKICVARTVCLPHHVTGSQFTLIKFTT